MPLFDFFRRKHSGADAFKKSAEAKQLLERIDEHNKDLEVVSEEYFEGPGKPYRYLYANGTVRAEGFYYYLGYDKRGEIVEEKFQGRNVEYFEDGSIKEVLLYKDGVLA